MQWDDIGFLISKNKYNENSVIAEFYTHNHGKCTGIIYGGTSKKVKNYLQLGNKINLNYKSKNENKSGYFNIEILEPVSPIFFDNQKKMTILLSAINILKLLTPELQKNINIYKLFENLVINIKVNDNSVILDYIYWELDILKEIGFDLNLNKNSIISNKKLSSIVIDNQTYNLPTFIFNRDYKFADTQHIYRALDFIGNFIDQKVIKPNNLIFPRFRLNLLKLYK